MKLGLLLLLLLPIVYSQSDECTYERIKYNVQNPTSYLFLVYRVSFAMCVLYCTDFVNNECIYVQYDPPGEVEETCILYNEAQFTQQAQISEQLGNMYTCENNDCYTQLYYNGPLDPSEVDSLFSDTGEP
eukprot:UN01587